MTATQQSDRSGDATIVQRDDQHRYELHIDGEVRGLIVYTDRGDARALVHTEVDDALQGQGFAAVLTERALADIRKEGRTVVPACPYVAHYLEQHPEVQDLLAS